MQPHNDGHTISSRHSEWHPGRHRSGENQLAVEYPASYLGRDCDSRHTTSSQSQCHIRSRSRSPPLSTSNYEHFPRQRRYFPSLTPPYSAERPLPSPSSPALLHPTEEEPRILFRSVDRNKNLAGNKVSAARCRDDQMSPPCQPAIPNAPAGTLTGTPHDTPTGPKSVFKYSLDWKPPRPGGAWTPIQQFHLEKLIAHGCVTHTQENAQDIEDVWLNVSPERGGGYGFGLTRESVMEYIMYQSCRFSGQTAKRWNGRQRKWKRWVSDNRGAVIKDGFGAATLAAAESPSLPLSADSRLPLTSTYHWTPLNAAQSPAGYEEHLWWKEGNSPLQPTMSVLSTEPTPGVQEVLDAIRAVTAKKGGATEKPEASFLPGSLTPRSNERGSSEISPLTTRGLYTYPQEDVTTIPTPATTMPLPSTVSSPSQNCPLTQRLVNSRSSTHLHLQINVTRGQHHALLDQLLDMPGGITLYNSSLSNGDRDGEQVIFIRVEVPRDYQKFMIVMIGKMPGVHEVVEVEDG